MFWPKQLPLTVSLGLLLCLLQSANVNGFIVPQELQSALSLVYSNIPPIKKGTDSRLGFGFRLGEHADFQVLLELGPQKNTRPLGEPSKDDQSFNKRQVSASEQREQLHQQELLLLTSTERNAASWLETWSKGMKPQPQPAKAKLKPGNKQVAKLALPTRPALATDAVQQLQLLYKMATKETPVETSTTRTTTEVPSAGESPNLDPPRGFKLPPPALTQDTNSLGNSKPTKSRAEITKELMNVSLEA